MPNENPRVTSPFEPAGRSEFSWGPGLTPPDRADAPPSQGGRYRPICPPTDHEAT